MSFAPNDSHGSGGWARELSGIVRMASMVVHPSRFLTSIKNIGLWLCAVRKTPYLAIWARYFDSAYYVRTYPDVSEKGVDPWLHFLLFGNVERRNPSDLFDTEYYLTNYPDVAATGLNALVHYSLFGAGEGRITKRPIEPAAAEAKASKTAMPEEKAAPVPFVPLNVKPAASSPQVVNNYWLSG